MTDNSDDEFDPILLQRLRDAVKDLPREAAPAGDTWPAIRARIESARVRALQPGVGTPKSFRFRQWHAIAVAATLFIAVTTLFTARRTTNSTSGSAVVQGRLPAVASTSPESTPSVPAPPVPVAVPRVLAPALAVVFARYDVATRELASDWQLRRERLDPSAVAVLDSCLRTINAAIAESRETLVQSPDNTTVAELLQVTYQQKLDLLKRAADLPQRTF